MRFWGGGPALESFQQSHFRDVRAVGAFFYTDLDLQPRTALRVDLSVPVTGSEVRIACEARIVGVESRTWGERSGIAIQFASCVSTRCDSSHLRIRVIRASTRVHPRELLFLLFGGATKHRDEGGRIHVGVLKTDY